MAVEGRLFVPLDDKLAMVKTWPGINPDDVDQALETAKADGTIHGYESEMGENPFLDAVVTVYRESVPATLVYVCERMRDAWDVMYYDFLLREHEQKVDDDRVRVISRAKPFVPNRIAIEVVDFGANWDQENGITLASLKKRRAARFADFAVIFNAVQSPWWLRQIDGQKVPYPTAAALLLNVPGYESWRLSPYLKPVNPVVYLGRSGGKLCGAHVGRRLYGHSAPVFRKYQRL